MAGAWAGVARESPEACSGCGAALAAGSALCGPCLLNLALADVPAPEVARAELSALGRVGPFVLLDVLGEGGMGVVYLAEQQHPVRRRVALKLMKWGLDSRAVLARLEAERQALARLSHPGIAQLYEAGTTDDGRPYFAMEQVVGGPLTRRCDELGLPIARRLRLFQAACEAVEHAHRRGIVHRDLKPSNILLGGDDDAPTVKVIDFGLAKATERKLADHTAFTHVGVLLGTPAYMAPEQADPRRPQIGPAADVYALGVVLYELLSGTLPFDPDRLRRDPVEMSRILREEEPRSLASTWSRAFPDAGEVARRRGTDARSLRRLLRGELSWIVGKCLEKDPRKRYAGPRELAADIERHLAHRPLVARRPGPGDRLGKLLRRHPTAVSAVTTALVTLALTTAGLVHLRRDGANPRFEQLTHSGLVRVGTISPSGRLLLYHERPRGNEPILWLLDRRTGALERLPDMPGPPLGSRFSRDEQAVYVEGQGEGRRKTLYRFSRDDLRWEEVLRDVPDGVTVSPDERSIAGVRYDPSTAESRLVVAGVGRGAERTIATRPPESRYDIFTAWSPDGRAIAVTVGTSGIAGRPVGVVEVDVETGRERPIGPQDWLYAQSKVYVPDGRALLVVGQRRGPEGIARGLYRLDRESGEVRRVPLDGLRPSGWRLSLSADGRTLAICAGRFRAGVWLLPGGDSSRAREVGAARRSPRFLRDGSLLYTGTDENVWVRRASGRTEQLAGRALDASPASDGRTLVATLVRDGVAHAFRIDGAGRSPVLLSPVPARETAVAPDGSYALFVSAADDRLWRVPLAGGTPVLLSRRPGRFPAFSPDGRFVVAVDPETEPFPRLRIVATDGSGERVLELPPGSAESPSSFRFSPDGTAIDHVRTDGSGVGNVWRMPIGGGPAVQLTHFSSEPMTGFDWSLDGRVLACLRGGWYGDVFLVRGEW
jgi:serine/threonine protein kinase/Tol biopolymer transport system component